ncbi:hypothetical protein V8C86DRAFT_2774182 [Haematococcus lacustris]
MQDASPQAPQAGPASVAPAPLQTTAAAPGNQPLELRAIGEDLVDKPMEEGPAQDLGLSQQLEQVQQLTRRVSAASTLQEPEAGHAAAPALGPDPGPDPAISVVLDVSQPLTQALMSLGLSLGRPAVLITEQALQAAAAADQGSGTGAAAGTRQGEARRQGQEQGQEGMRGLELEEEEDSFYDLTPEDYAALARAAEVKRKEEASGLKTQAMREAEERAREQAFSSIAVRVRFPDGLVMQAAFAASEPLGALKAAVAQLLLPGTAFTLFVTPPKQVLKDMTQSFYKAGLVPAAHVHCALELAGQPGALPAGEPSALGRLRPELQPCVITRLQPGFLLPGQQQPSSLPPAQQGQAVQGSLRTTAASGQAGPGTRTRSLAEAGSGAGAGGRPSGEPKVPKWLKMGK